MYIINKIISVSHLQWDEFDHRGRRSSPLCHSRWLAHNRPSASRDILSWTCQSSIGKEDASLAGFNLQSRLRILYQHGSIASSNQVLAKLSTLQFKERRIHWQYKPIHLTIPYSCCRHRSPPAVSTLKKTLISQSLSWTKSKTSSKLLPSQNCHLAIRRRILQQSAMMPSMRTRPGCEMHTQRRKSLRCHGIARCKKLKYYLARELLALDFQICCCSSLSLPCLFNFYHYRNT